MITRRKLTAAGGAVLAAGLLATTTALPASAATSTANVSITAGSLGFVSVTSPINYGTLTLTGADLTTSQPVTLDVSDARGSGAGWNITATSTDLSAAGPNYLTGSGTAATAITGVVNATPGAWSCDAGSTCNVPTLNSGAGAVTYPYAMPVPAALGGAAPTATKIYSANSNSGLGNAHNAVTVYLGYNNAGTVNNFIPGGAAAAAGSYSATWTFSLVSGP